MIVATSAPTAQAKRPQCDGKRATIVGTEERDRLRGTAGSDVIAALGGRDGVKRVDAEDRVCAGGGGDRVAANLTAIPEDPPARDTTPVPKRAGRGDQPQLANLGGGADRLVVRCTSADPRTQTQVNGGAGDDELEIDCATADRVAAGPGDDLVYAGLGRDEVWGEEGNDVLVDEFSRVEDCEQGLPLLYPQYGPDRRCVRLGRQLFLEYEDQWLGGEGDDVVRGGKANDWMAGEEGNDRLFGGAGADTVAGGEGNDYCDGGDLDDAFDVNGGGLNDLPICETALGFETWVPRTTPMFPDCDSSADPAGYAECLSTRPHVARISWSPSTLDLAASGSARLIVGIHDPFPREPHIQMHRYRAEVTSSIGETTTVDGYCGAYEWGPTDYDCPSLDFDVIARRDAVSWRVTGLTIFYVGHERSIYTERDLEQQLGGQPPALQVNATTDHNPPDAYLLSVEPETVDVSATDRWVTFTYFARDGETRVDHGDVRVSHRGDEVPSQASSALIVDDWPEVQFSEHVMIPQGSPSGEYEITVRVEDRFGNARVYGPGQPFQLDPSTFEVTNGP
jgi:RTX calcium-binding nonapeptide repeat (4 copies)